MKRCIRSVISVGCAARAPRGRESTPARRVRPAFRSAASSWTRLVGRGILVVLLFGAASPAWTQARPEVVSGDAAAESTEARLRAALEVDPDDAARHAEIGGWYHSQARYPEARDAYARAVRLEPMNAAYRRGLGRASLALGAFAEAEVHFAWGAELAPQDPAMYTGLGEALIGQGRHSAARAALEQAVRLDPDDPEVERLLAETGSPADRADRPELDPAASNPGRAVGRALTYLFGTALALAGIGLLLPVGAAVVVLVLFLPRAVLHRLRV